MGGSRQDEQEQAHPEHAGPHHCCHARRRRQYELTNIITASLSFYTTVFHRLLFVRVSQALIQLSMITIQMHIRHLFH